MHISTFCLTRLPWISLSVLVHIKLYHDYSACAGSFSCLEGSFFTELSSRLSFLSLRSVHSPVLSPWPLPSPPSSLCVLIALTFLCVHLFINFQDILGRGFVFYDVFSTSSDDLEPSVQSLKFLFILPFQTKPQTLFSNFGYQNTRFSF